MASAAGGTTGVIFGGFLFLGFVLIAIASTIILSLIGIYTTNTSAEGTGSEYRINALILKGFYTNGTFTLKNGSTVDSSTLSSLCTSAYQQLGVQGFTGCVIENIYATTSGNLSNTTRRRRSTEAGVYLACRARLFYSSTCEGSSDKNKLSNDTSASGCAKKRLAECAKFVGTESTAQLLSTTTLTLYILDTTSSYQSIVLSRIYRIPQALAYYVAAGLGLDSSTLSSLSKGCYFYQSLSKSAISAAISAQASVTTTAATTSSAAG